MPAAGSSGGRRSARLPTVLFWSGVGLAPLAVLLLLVGQGSLPLQLAAALAVLALVLIGLSITLRLTGASVPAAVEDMVFEEIDALREDIRGDITHAARATHKSLADRIVALNDTVEALRGQVESLRGQLERAANAPPPRAAAPAQHHPTHAGVAGVQGGVLRHTETVKVTTRQTTVVDPNEARRDGTVYGTRSSQPRGSGEFTRGSGEYSGEYGSGQFSVPQQRRPERIAPPIEAGPREESWTEQLLRERLERHENDRPSVRQESWSTPDRGPERTGGGRRRAYDPDDDGDDRVTGMRTTDRWASVRSDERGGRELRMGERRAAMHEDESGTELRIEDRWASVRREDARQSGESWRDDSRPSDDSWRELPRRSAAGRERDRSERSGEWSSGSSWSSQDDNGRWSERRGAAALPSAPTEPPASSWTSGWTSAPRDGDRSGERSGERARDGERSGERARDGERSGERARDGERSGERARDGERLGERARDGERYGRRHRADDEDYAWNGGRDEEQRGRTGRRLVDFEHSDDRWR